MVGSFESSLINALEKVYDEESTEKKQVYIKELIDSIKHYSNQLHKGRYREAGYGEIFVTYFKNFTVSIVFGTEERNNGSGCLLRLNRDFLITNAHVIKGAIEAKRLLIGSVEVYNIEEKIVSIDDDLDLAVIDLSESLNKDLEDTGKMFFTPESWPPSESEIGDQVYIAGFPGIFREDEEMFSSIYYTAIHEEIMDVTDRRLIVKFSRENWKKALGLKEISDLKRLGGLSGGPVFICRDDKPELVGFTYEDGGGFFDGVKVIKSYFINNDGEIIRNVQ
ncbi:peptidase Do [Bhargavaea cecembensis DSE10]|uniref:Peptidase Do n=1 Tax=Bhargavaea cecembensis DSE10 TaxID=1235279 RepID=M7NB68_9BACL|nr:serine protease [Bhargavaea cecembensis]EMR05788.1 peptidase Do [Bhargavaea cecembensis DSE10]